MTIEQFVAQSEGQWRSMRSGHSIAFRQFEQIVSKIKVKILAHDDPKVIDFLKSTNKSNRVYLSPFEITWEVESDWVLDDSNQISSGHTILIPIPETTRKGFLLRSTGYTESMPSLSNYSFLSDGTLTLSTKYQNTVTEERIWFLSQQVRCRSSVIFTEKKSGIIQTSFASELKIQGTN